MNSCMSGAGAGRLLDSLASIIAEGASLENALDHIFESFQEVIPFDRIGFADIDEEHGVAVAHWSRSRTRVLLRNGYSAPLRGSSLSVVLEQRKPRVLNNLPEYLSHRPNSRSSALVVKEGIKSSMTCPLYVDGDPVAFLFFSSFEFDTYTDDHVRLMKDIATRLASLLLVAKTTTNENRHKSSRSNRPPMRREPYTVLDFRLSQLKPGMVLANPVRLPNGSVLLSAGTTLSQPVIDRLHLIQQSGTVDFDAVNIQ
ncbi:MAG: GAF domain-containing protein [Planctomycetota bacterium]